MFHHASRLHPNLTKEELWAFVTDNSEAAMGAQSHLPQLQAILMGKLPVSNVSQKGFLSLVDRNTKRVFNEHYQQVAGFQNIANKFAIGPIAKFMIYTAGMPIESVNPVREAGQTLVNQLEKNTDDFDTSRVLANDSVVAINPFESAKSDELLQLLKDDLDCDKYDQNRLHNILKGRSRNFHNKVVDLIKARDSELGMTSIHKGSIADFIKISNAYLNGNLQPATTIIGNEK
jgi:hypothetical protein